MNESFSTHCTIDHFFWNNNLERKVLEAGVLRLPENTSDHSPIYCIIENSHCKSHTNINPKTNARHNWTKATVQQKDNFNKTLQCSLLDISIPDCLTECRNIHCRNEDHLSAIDMHMITILKTIDDNVKNVLPYKDNNSLSVKKTIPERFLRSE